MTPNGFAIRDFREARELSLRRLADLAGIDPGYLSRIEQEKQGAGDQTLQRIACELSVHCASITREKPRDQE